MEGENYNYVGKNFLEENNTTTFKEKVFIGILDSNTGKFFITSANEESYVLESIYLITLLG